MLVCAWNIYKIRKSLLQSVIGLQRVECVLGDECKKELCEWIYICVCVVDGGWSGFHIYIPFIVL